MKRSLKNIAAIVLAVLVLNTTPLLAAEYTLDPDHSRIGFRIKHMTISKVNGSFSDFNGAFAFTPGQPDTWQVTATIQTASIDTDHKDRDKHLMSDDFFDVAQYPTMIFKSTKVALNSDNEGEITGDLTMHGVTKSVTLDLIYNGSVMDPWGNERAGFSATGDINRKDWGLSYNSVLEAGGLTLGETVRISLEIEGIKAK